MKQPDNFFNGKLQHHEVVPPSAAWARIAHASALKKRGVAWYYMAASMLLLGAIGATVWLNQSDSVTEQQSIATTHQARPIEQKIDKNEKHPLPIIDSLASVRRKTRSVAAATPNNHKRALQKSIHPSIDLQPTKAREHAEVLVAVPMKIENPMEGEKLEEPISNYKLVVQAAEVNQKYLKKSTTDATPEDKRASGMRKLLDKANDLAHVQDPYGDLRQMKDEMLAINISGAKKKNQNR